MAVMSRYNRWIYETMAPHIGSRLLEAGCGTGNLTSFLIQTPGLKEYVGVDLSPAFCDQLRRDLHPPKRMKIEFHAMDLQSPALKSLARFPFDSIVCSNVLEHLQDDRAALRTFFEMLAPGGKVILQAPALPMLYGSIDAADQHVRRYSRRDLVSKVEETGFVVKQAAYFNLLGIPAWIWHGKILKHQTHPKEDLRAWDRWVPLIRKLESLITLPVGLSIFVIAEKADTAS
jgi:2-polyprenyl-3-methyl-5-hydroxy-6-metoxy-1,4-benzoquinol methylase